eukprot:CAMPEP_0184649526 /NCGR_PEP_ID=MMETSP0308-20130426/6918_1 /TAXON_ID=38269 /ORGANISM="Gloeochaete witrockiana, Strain SAG 46.84" /LENGTH=221 /DNA_ID=CAMNT_0027082343 /DNA_START=335 /DNA_END=997 /DNA_ORIENTATION=-
MALDRGLLPHTNAGPLSENEMLALKEVNASMGLMLESIAPDLKVHKHAPSKSPQLRVKQLELAGQLRIPFTTGLLLGIGESEMDCIATLEAIRDVHARFGNIQECIMQPFSPGVNEHSGGQPSNSYNTSGKAFPLEDLPNAVKLAREILQPSIAIQIPPNLVHAPEILGQCLKAGASDLGGIGPKDEVNPQYEFPTDVQAILGDEYRLVHRLPVHTTFYDW